LEDVSCRSKIVMTILLDTKLAKGGVEGAQSMIERSQPKREKALALAVLYELTKQEPKGLPYYPEVTVTTPKSGSSKGKGNKSKSKGKTKATTLKGSSKAQPKAEKATTKGGKVKGSTPSKGGSKPQPKAEKVVVYNYKHYETDYGVVTIPTLGKAELEDQIALSAFKHYLEGCLMEAHEDMRNKPELKDAQYEAYCSKLADTLKGVTTSDLETLCWSNKVTPTDIEDEIEQIVILKDNKKAKMAWRDGITLDDLTPLKGWKVTRKSTRKQTSK